MVKMATQKQNNIDIRHAPSKKKNNKAVKNKNNDA